MFVLGSCQEWRKRIRDGNITRGSDIEMQKLLQKFIHGYASYDGRTLKSSSTECCCELQRM
jgi:hypothetical protein